MGEEKFKNLLIAQRLSEDRDYSISCFIYDKKHTPFGSSISNIHYYNDKATPLFNTLTSNVRLSLTPLPHLVSLLQHLVHAGQCLSSSHIHQRTSFGACVCKVTFKHICPSDIIPAVQNPRTTFENPPICPPKYSLVGQEGWVPKSVCKWNPNLLVSQEPKQNFKKEQ